MRTPWVWAIRIAVLILVLVPLFLGAVSESNITSWLILACLLNSVSCLSSVMMDRLYQLALILFADFLFYVMIELDAPCSFNPYAFYLSMLGIFSAGVLAHYMRNRRAKGRLMMMAAGDVLLNGLFLSLDAQLLKI